MHTSLKLTLATVAGSLAFASHASAATVSAMASEFQLSDGQDFALTLGGLAPSDGTGGTLTLNVRGDYEEDITTIDEFITLDAEGLLVEGPIGGFDGQNEGVGVGGPFDSFTRYAEYTDVEFQRTFVLSGALLDSLLADSQLDVALDLSEGVNVFNDDAGVKITLTYDTAMAAVPLPASLPLILAGLGGFGLLKRRKKA